MTGGSRGIGLAVAKALAAEGADVALLARDKAALETARETVAVASGRQVLSGNYPITVVDVNTYTITAGANAVLGKTLSGTTPLSVTNASTLVTVTDTGHNIENGLFMT